MKMPIKFLSSTPVHLYLRYGVYEGIDIRSLIAISSSFLFGSATHTTTQKGYTTQELASWT